MTRRPYEHGGGTTRAAPESDLRTLALVLAGTAGMVAVVVSGAPFWLCFVAALAILVVGSWLTSRLTAKGPAEAGPTRDTGKLEPDNDEPPEGRSVPMTDDRVVVRVGGRRSWQVEDREDGVRAALVGVKFLTYVPVLLVITLVASMTLLFAGAGVAVATIPALILLTAGVGVAIYTLGLPRSRAAIADSRDWEASGECPVCGGGVVWTDRRCSHCGTALDPAEH